MTSPLQQVFGLTVLVIALVGVLVVAIVRFRAAFRRSTQPGLESSESAFMAAAMQEAVMRLRDKEQAQQARADASERLSEDIVSGLTSGLIVVTADGRTRIVNPAARRLLNVPDSTKAEPNADGASYRDVLGHVPPLAEVIDESLRTQQPIVRRVLDLRALPTVAEGGGVQLGITVSPIVDAKA